MFRYLFFYLFTFSVLVHAEYRVYELEITTFAELPVQNPAELAQAPAPPQNPLATAPANPPEALGKITVISNLDPEQYRGYHTILPNQSIRYVSTWKCPGRTSYKDYCPNPKVKTEEVSAATPLETQ